MDRKAGAQARLASRSCAACGREASNAHHVIPRGSPYFGDDVVENLVVVCGTGTGYCHGALHGSPYVDKVGRRWTEQDVRYAIGEHLVKHRPDVIAYVLAKLGDVAGADYLVRRYGVGRVS